MKTNRIGLLSLTVLLIGLLTACDKNNDEGDSKSKARLQIYLTDAPTEAVSEVWIDLKEIQINSSDTGSWTPVPGIHAGIYNLMDLTDERDTILADAEIQAGRINQLRLILGDNNYIITTDGQKEMLNTPGAEESGLKLQVHSDLTGGMLYQLVLDFDAAKSIIKAGNSGKHLLKPVIRVLSFVPSGGIVKGFVSPDSVSTTIFATIGVDTISSTSTFGGNFQFRDIMAGNYVLSFVPASDEFYTASKNIVVSLGQTTIADTIKLEHK